MKWLWEVRISIKEFFFSIVIFLFSKNYLSKIQWSYQVEKVVCHMGKYTFGVYLVYALFRDIFDRLGFNSMIINTIVWYF